MKKIIAITLMLALLASGCAANVDPKGTVSSAQAQENAQPPEAAGTVTPAETKEAAAPEVTAPEEDGPKESEADELPPDGGVPAETDAEPAAQEPEDEADSEFGRINGGVYENTYFGIGCELDSDWAFATEAELAEMNGLAASVINDEDLKKAIENSGSVFDMYATSAQGLFSMSVNIEKLNALYGLAITEEAYIDLSIEQLKQMLASVDGVSNAEVEKQRVDFAGAEHFAAKIAYEVAIDAETTVPGYELIVCIKNGNYVAAVTLSTVTVDLTGEAASLFYALEA